MTDTDCPATCFGATCDQLVNAGHACYWLESIGCDCGKCSKCSSNSPTSYCSLNCPGEEGEGTCDCVAPFTRSLDFTDDLSIELEYFLGCQGLKAVKVARQADNSPVEVYGFCEGEHTSMCQVEENALQCGLGITYHMEDYLLLKTGSLGKSIKRVLEEAEPWIEFEALLTAQVAFDGTELEIIGVGNVVAAVSVDLLFDEMTLAGIDLSIELSGVLNFDESRLGVGMRVFGELQLLGIGMDFEYTILEEWANL